MTVPLPDAIPGPPDPAPRPLDHLVLRGDDARPALVPRAQDGGCVLDYAALRERVALLAGWLRARLPERGARVASWAGKSEATCLLPLAAARAGLAHVPVNPLLKRAQVAHVLADSGAALLVANQARLAGLDSADIPPGCTTITEEALWDGVHAGALRLGPSDADPHDLCAVLYTSGSTGLPKGVMLSHANLWLGAASVAHYLALAADDVVLALLPLSFDYGQNQLLSAWHAGGCVVALDYLLPRHVIRACARHLVTTLAAVPPLWLQLAEQDWPDDAIAAMRRLTNSGGALTEPLVRRLRNRFPKADLVAMYGLTEAFRSTWLDPALIDAHPTSIGRAIPFAEIMVLRADGAPADVGEEGELVHCGPLVAQGYWNDPSRTAERFRPAPPGSAYGGTAVWSGDRVRRDAAGLLHFAGRRDAMIKTLGNRVSPEEIERAALATGLTAEAAAFGAPDERLGEAIYLVIRPAAGLDETAVSAQLTTALRRDLPGFMQPATIRVIGTMPLTPNGKLDRARLARGGS